MFDESSPEYGRNLQNMQNMMGETSDLYDLVQSTGHYFDWSDEETSLRLLQGVLLSMVGVSAAVYFIPFHLICLGGGVTMFMINTRFAKYLVKELTPMLTQLNQQILPWVIQQNEKIETYIQEHDRIQDISLYENQRWSNEASAFTSHVSISSVCVGGVWLLTHPFLSLSSCSRMNVERGRIIREVRNGLPSDRTRYHPL